MHKNKWLYKHVHSVHHQVYTPYAFSALYNHPFEGFIMDTIGGAIPALILDMHPWCCAVFYSVATLKTVDDHCGYVLPYDPFQLLFQNNTKYHNIHHSGKGQIFNFSQPFFTFWDDFMGSRASSVDVADLKLSKKTD